MDNSVSRYDGSSANYVLNRTIVGMHHFQYSGCAINNPIDFCYFALNAYHDSDNRSYGYWLSVGLSFGRDGRLVG